MGYPSTRSILYLSLGALSLAQLVIFPSLTYLYSPQLGLAAAELSVVWLLGLFIRHRRLRTEDLLLLNATPLPTLGLTLPVAISASLLIAEVDLFFGELMAAGGLPLPLYFQRSLFEIQLVRDLPELGLGVLAVVVLPGICEELFFRGFVLTGLCARHGPRTAVLGPALIFALAHFNPWQFPALFLFGAFLGLLVYWSHSIYPAILAHTVNNLLSFAGVNLKAYWGLEILDYGQHLPLPALISALGVLGMGLLLLRRQPPLMPLLAGPWTPLLKPPLI